MLYTNTIPSRLAKSPETTKHIILLHGWGMHSGVWSQTAEMLAEYFHVTVVDLPGYAQSNNIATEDFDGICKQIATSLRDQVDSPAIWLGWSLGGLFATGIALQYPALVHQLILVASTPRFVKDKHWGAMDAEVFEEFSGQLKENYQLTLKRFMSLQTRNSENSQESLKLLRRQWQDVEPPTQSVLEASLEILKTVDMRDKLKYLKCPLSFIYGKLDTLARPALLGQMKNYTNNFDSIVIEKSAHAPFLSHPDQFLSAVLESVNKHG